MIDFVKVFKVTGDKKLGAQQVLFQLSNNTKMDTGLAILVTSNFPKCFATVTLSFKRAEDARKVFRKMDEKAAKFLLAEMAKEYTLGKTVKLPKLPKFRLIVGK